MGNRVDELVDLELGVRVYDFFTPIQTSTDVKSQKVESYLSEDQKEALGLFQDVMQAYQTYMTSKGKDEKVIVAIELCRVVELDNGEGQATQITLAEFLVEQGVHIKACEIALERMR